MKWISVDEILPEKHMDWVIVASSKGIGLSAFNKLDNEFGRIQAGNSDFHAKITHWMPLPEPPKN